MRISQRSVRQMKEAAVPLYEHVFLARQDLSQAQVDALAATATEIVETNQEYLDRGGHLVVLCPQTRIVGKNGDVQF